MSSKPVVQRTLAHRDVEEAISHYQSIDHSNGSGSEVALGFVDEMEMGYQHISVNPATGSPRYAHELNLPGLRRWPLSKYPYLIFYVEHEQHIEVWRVLHMAKDIADWMTRE